MNSFVKNMFWGGILLSMCACGGKHQQDAAENGYAELYTPQYAEGFRILGDSAHKSVIIESINPWQGAENEVRRLFIGLNGGSAPEGFDGQVAKGYPQRIAVMSSTQIAMLDAIDMSEKIYGVSGLDYVYSSSIQSRRDSIADIGYEGNIDYEKLLGLNPDLIMLYGVNGPNPMERKLHELNIPYIYIGDYLEQSPLGKAEWIVAVAEAIGARTSGINAFAPLPERYKQLKATADSLSDEQRPKVMINTPYGDSWFIPAKGSYAVRLIEDAGGEVAYTTEGNSSKAIDMEQAYLLASEADVWINTGDATTMREVIAMCPKTADTPTVRSGNVFNNNLRRGPAGGSDYWEGGVMHPDLILRDLIKIFHPGAFPNDTLVYYRKLY